MTSLDQKPVCLVVGRESASYRYLCRRLDSKATFFEVSEERCHEEVLRVGADFVVILASCNSRACATTIHRVYPEAKIILEASRSGLVGAAEKNGFLSVIEKSQSRSELSAHLESALLTWNAAGDKAPEPSGELDFSAIAGRLSSIPGANEDLDRLGHNLLDLLLGAVKSGTGGFFALDPLSQEYRLVASRNLAPRLDLTSLPRSSKVVRSLSSGHAFRQSHATGTNDVASKFAQLFECNFVLPLNISGALYGWFVLSVADPLLPGAVDALSSIGFFAAESLKQSLRVIEAREKNAQDRMILTRTTDALAWIDSNGDLEVIHDATGLLRLRSHEGKSSYKDLVSSALKNAVRRAQSGELIRFETGGGRQSGALLGSASQTTKGGVMLVLRKRADSESAEERDTFQKILAYSMLQNLIADPKTVGIAPNDLAAIRPWIEELARLEKGGRVSLRSLVDSISTLILDLEYVPGSVDDGVLMESDHALVLVLITMSAHLRWADLNLATRLHLSESVLGLGIQIDFSHRFDDEQSANQPAKTRIETLALEVAHLGKMRARFVKAAFGARFETHVPKALLNFDKDRLMESRVEPDHIRDASQTGIIVLHNEVSFLNQEGNELPQNGTVTASNNQSTTRGTGKVGCSAG